MKLIYSSSSQISLVVFLMFAFFMAGISGFFINETKLLFEDWQIYLPSWSIPLWALTPIWTFFYLFLAIAQWFLWGDYVDISWFYKLTTVLFWCTQIILSGLWSVFLYVDPLGIACMLFTVMLLITVFVCIVLYNKIAPYASIVIEFWYFLWCCYLLIFVIFLRKINN